MTPRPTRSSGRARLAAATAAPLVLLGALAVAPASAHESDEPHEHEILSTGDVDVSGYPVLELVISVPSGAVEAAGNPDAYAITETVVDDFGNSADVTHTPEVEPLAATRLDVVLAIDTSGSMSGGALDAARTASLAFVAALPETARIAIVGFGPTPTVASPLTADRAVLAEAIEGLQAGGETALYDALIAAAAQIDAGSDARTALVVLSDGGDTVSTATLDVAATRAANQFDVVHAVSLITGEQDTAALGSITSGGGEVVQAEDPVALAGVYRDVADRIINQYVLRWETSAVSDGDVSIVFDGGSTAYAVTKPVDLTSVASDPASRDGGSVTETDSPDAAAGPATASPPDLVTTPPTVPNPSAVGGWLLVLGLLFVAIALFVSGMVAFGPRERTRNLAAEFRQRIPRGRELTGVGKRIVEAVEHFLRRDPDRQVSLALRLERAGLDWSPAEYVAVLLAGAAVLALLGFGLLGLLGLVILPTLGVIGGLAWVDKKGRTRTQLFTSQLDSTLQLMAGSLRSGFGIMQALATVSEETEWPTCEEFTQVLGEVRLGRDLGAALKSSARRVASDDFEWVVQAIEISREVGGNLSEVLDNISNTIRQRNTLRRQVVALSAEGRISGLILFSLPFAMLAWMRITNAEYIEVLFDRGGGQISVLIAVVLMTIGAFWMRKIVRVRF